MKITETDIPDVVVENIDKSKVILANNIMKNVYPLFDEIYSVELSKSKEIENALKVKKIEVHESKEELQSLLNHYNKNKKKLKLLNRISKLVSSGLVYDSTLKNETVILLKVIDKLPEDKLDYHLLETMKLISKRFAK